MAYFRCGQGSGSGGASYIIQISTDYSPFYGQTITITKDGTPVGTTVFDAQGEAEYSVDEPGQYTVSCQGYTDTVDVINEFQASINAVNTITVTIYSTASDTVTFTDETGEKTATTDTNGAASNIQITFNGNSASISFASGVAKDPDSLGNYYSKTVSITRNTTEIYVMPENVLYWWGYRSSNLEGTTAANGWLNTGGYTPNAPTFNTNSVTLGNTTDYNYSGIGTVSSVVSNKVYSVAKGISGGGNILGVLAANTTKYMPTTSVTTSYNSTSTAKYEITTSGNDYILMTGGVSGRYCEIYALWYE